MSFVSILHSEGRPVLKHPAVPSPHPRRVHRPQGEVPPVWYHPGNSSPRPPKRNSDPRRRKAAGEDINKLISFEINSRISYYAAEAF